MSAGQLEPLLGNPVKINRAQTRNRVFLEVSIRISRTAAQQHREQEAKVWQIDGHPQGGCQRYCTRASWELPTLRAL
jgi:hypothetical protein